MRKRYSLIAVCILASLAGRKAEATHAAGMDLTYICYDGDTYQFVASFYRDCSGIDAPFSLSLELTSPSCGVTNYYTMQKVFSTEGTDSISHLAGLCPDLPSKCAGGFLQGYEQYIYAVNVTLPLECNDWRASTAVSARNNAITNLQTPGNYDLYVECHFTNVDICNSSPQFTIIPLAYSCVEELFVYNHGAYDPDGDSLSYKLVNPLHNAFTPIGYSSFDLNPTYPLYTTSGDFGFDVLTGQMSCIPSSQQIVVISVLIDEFRNGEKIGSAQRDLQVVIQPCDNNVPEIPDGIVNVVGGVLVDSNTVKVCPGNTLEFDLIGVDEDNVDDLTVTSNIGIVLSDAVLTTYGSNPTTTHITWETALNDSGYYVFTITIKDDACPISGQQVYSYTIEVSLPPVSAGPDLTGCANNPVVELNVEGLSPYLWNNSVYLSSDTAKSPLATFPGPGTYEFVVLADAGGLCENSDTVSVLIYEALGTTLQALPDTICSGEQVVISSTASGGDGTYGYAWSSVPGGFSGTNSSITVNPLVTTTFFLDVTSDVCEHQDSVQVYVRQLPVPAIATDTSLCLNETTLISAVVVDPDATYTWNFEGGTVASGSGGGPYEVSWNATGSYEVSLDVVDAFGCASSSQITVVVNPYPVANFTCNVGGCEPLIVQFDNNSTGAATYLWDFGDGTTGSDTDPTHTYSQGLYTVTLTAISEAGCVATLTMEDLIEVLPVPVACGTVAEDLTFPIDISQATFHFENCSQFGESYLWEFGDGNASAEVAPTYTYTGLGEYFVLLTASNAYCSDTALIGPIIIDEFIDVYFPTAFSPNGDNVNDYFHELSQYGIVDIHFAVFNRWGELVFENTNISDPGWDGTFKGKDCEVGVYVWKATATFVSGKTFDFKGDVSLVR